jgi:hypothetical protein
MEITRHPDGTLTVPVPPDRHAEPVEGGEPGAVEGPRSLTLHPGEGGYVEALAEWDLQQDPDRTAATSTKSGREEAMAVVHAVAEDPAHEVHKAVESLHDEESSAEALRHVLVGGVPSVKAFAEEVAEAEGGDVLAPHTATKIIGEVLAELDS